MGELFILKYSKKFRYIFMLFIILYLGIISFIGLYYFKSGIGIWEIGNLSLLSLILIVSVSIAIHFFQMEIFVYEWGVKIKRRGKTKKIKKWEDIKEIHHTNFLSNIFIGFTTIEFYDGTKIRVKPDMKNYKRCLELVKKNLLVEDSY